MKTIVIVLVLGMVFACSNASFLEHLFNNTRLRGNAHFNTTKGISIGYDGKLVFDNGYIGVDLMNLGANFKAVPRAGNSLGNTTNKTVDYSGNVHVTQGKYQADLGVNGTAGLKAEYEVNANGTAGSYNATLTNENQWTIDSNNYSVEGGSNSVLNASGGGCIVGNTIHVAHGARGVAKAAGNVTSNGDTKGFQVLKWGEGGVKKKIEIINKTGSNFFGSHAPSVAYEGAAGFKKKEVVTWGDTNAHSELKAGGVFNGLIWADAKKINDTINHNVFHVRSADFGYKGKTRVDDEGTTHFGGVGTVTRIGGAHMNITNGGKDFTGKFGELGNLVSIGIVKTKAEKGDEQKFNQELEELKKKGPVAVMLEEHQNRDGKRPIKTFVHAQWAAGKGVTVHHNDDKTVDVATEGGAKWNVVGADSKSKKPWHTRGSRTYNSTFEYDAGNSMIKNADVQLGQDTKMVDDYTKEYENMKGELNQAW